MLLEREDGVRDLLVVLHEKLLGGCLSITKIRTLMVLDPDEACDEGVGLLLAVSLKTTVRHSLLRLRRLDV